MISRAAKLLLISAIAFYYTLVVFNNITDFDSNYQFVRHVLMMDTTFPGNKGMWRALNAAVLHLAFYVSIILWEAATMVLGWWGAFSLFRTLRSPVAEFNAAKRIPLAALALGMLMWFGAFLTVGGEWFLMWQSRNWNGQEAAFRMFAVLGIVLLLVLQPDREEQP
jgi:predicted small integral membrane protein